MPSIYWCCLRCEAALENKKHDEAIAKTSANLDSSNGSLCSGGASKCGFPNTKERSYTGSATEARAEQEKLQLTQKLEAESKFVHQEIHRRLLESVSASDQGNTGQQQPFYLKLP